MLFFHPPDKTITQQLATISMCEGIIDFSGKFSPESPLEVVSMDKFHYTFYNCEPNTWMVLVSRIPANLCAVPGDATQRRTPLQVVKAGELKKPQLDEKGKPMIDKTPARVDTYASEVGHLSRRSVPQLDTYSLLAPVC